MNTPLFLTSTLLLSLLLETACSSVPTPDPQSAVSMALLNTGKDPVSVVKAYVATENTGDFQKTLDFYAEDAVFNSPQGLLIGKQEIAKFLEQDVKTTRATPESTVVKGPFVIDTGTVSIARYQEAGLGLTKYRTEYIIDQDGKIRFFAPTSLLTPEQEAKWRAELAKAGPRPTQAVDPIEVAKAYVQAANAGDFEKALSFYADSSAVLVQNGELLAVGKQQIADWLKSDVQITRATPQGWQLQGNMVINTGTVYVIQDGKIRFFRPSSILTPEQQAKLQAAQATPTSNP
jgi:ketosteroid isomerase-like protein